MPGALRDAVGDEVHGVEAGHVLLLQEKAALLSRSAKTRDQHVSAGNLLAAGRLHMHHGAMDDALEARRGLGLAVLVEDEVGSAPCR